MIRLRQLVRGETGATLVETALSATILLGVLIGMMWAFLALYGYHYAAYAAREGSRWAMVRGSQCNADSLTMPGCNATPDQIQSYVQGLGFPGINSDNVTVTTAWQSPSTTLPTRWTPCTPNDCNEPGDLVTVNVTYAFPLNIPFMSARTLNITSRSSMVINQ